MNEKLIDELLNYMERTKDFITQECPELILEILKYHKILNFCNITIFLPILIISLIVFIYFWKFPYVDKYDCTSTGTLISMMISGFSSVFCFIILIQSVEALIKIYTAPKYFIIHCLLKMKG